MTLLNIPLYPRLHQIDKRGQTMQTATIPFLFPQDPDAFVRAKECATYLGIGTSTFWLYVKQGRIQRPYKIGEKTSVWQAGYIRQFQRELIAEARD